MPHKSFPRPTGKWDHKRLRGRKRAPQKGHHPKYIHPSRMRK